MRGVSRQRVRTLAVDFGTGRFPGTADAPAYVLASPSDSRFALAGTPEECAERLRAMHAALPEVTGVRLYALPPPSASWFGGYVEMTRALGRMIALTNA